ncbi:MAG: Rrf2 family transcriptional regulator [Sutterellaceae bacterium]|nr:Rrf2 family transcriptional regulator [Sutterellaceae bacterium]MDY2869121.1 Rrf2 family transcriptional regulator [Mesosutterella sp.]
MQLTRYTDYSLRVLLYLAVDRDRTPPVTVDELSQQFNISRNHLVKIVHELGRSGLLLTVRGRGGGVKLARDPSEYRIGEIVRMLEGGKPLIDCRAVGCVLTGRCSLSGALWKATVKFFEELDKYTLADALDDRTKAAVEEIHPSIEALLRSRELLCAAQRKPACAAPSRSLSATRLSSKGFSITRRVKIHEES